MINPKVIKVQPEQNYMLTLWFANGEQRCFDMKSYLDFEVFRALKGLTSKTLCLEKNHYLSES